MTTPAILAEGLLKRYGELVAVDRCSFAVEEGEVFGFLGPNGAGKTSTMRMIACVSPTTEGRLEVFGMSVDEHPREIKALIGVVSQENNLDPDLTVYENLTVFARFFEIDRAEAAHRAEELIGFFGLTEKRDTVIEALSGGMKRRLTIARALINRPRLVILDEPTTGLDPQARALIWERLRALRAAGLHDPPLDPLPRGGRAVLRSAGDHGRRPDPGRGSARRDRGRAHGPFRGRDPGRPVRDRLPRT